MVLVAFYGAPVPRESAVRVPKFVGSGTSKQIESGFSGGIEVWILNHHAFLLGNRVDMTAENITSEVAFL
jgi:hypothetical protein